MDLTQQLAAIILPVLVVPAIGFAWAKSGNTFDNRFITQLVTNIGTPALTADAPLQPPLVVRLIAAIPGLNRLPGRAIGLGLRREHVVAAIAGMP